MELPANVLKEIGVEGIKKAYGIFSLRYMETKNL